MTVNNNNAFSREQAQLMRRATYASVTVAFILIVIKLFAYVLSGSVALLSSLIDSVLDAFASIVNLLAVRHSLTPADREHRFGHGKAEPLAGLGQAAFITGSSIFLVFEALNHMINPRPIEHGTTGIVVITVSLLFTIALLTYQKHVVRKTGSIAIEADSVHYLSDIILNLSVIAALVLSTYMKMPIADPIIAMCIAVYVIYSAWTILANALNQLMDRELPDADRQSIRNIVLGHTYVRNLHELRTRTAGQDVFIQLHLELDGRMPLVQAHAIADEVEENLRSAFPNADIIIHEDPAGVEDNPNEPD